MAWILGPTQLGIHTIVGKHATTSNAPPRNNEMDPIHTVRQLMCPQNHEPIPSHHSPLPSVACGSMNLSSPSPSSCLSYHYGTTLIIGFYPSLQSARSLHQYKQWLPALFGYILTPIIVFTTPEWKLRIQQWRNNTMNYTRWEQQNKQQQDPRYPPTPQEIQYFIQQTRTWDSPQAKLIASWHTTHNSSMDSSYDASLATYFITDYDHPWELPPVRNVTEQEWYKQREMAKTHNKHLYAVWTSKSWMVAHGASLNPFRSKYFMWLDAGAMRDPYQRVVSFGDPDILDSIYGNDPYMTRQQWEQHELKQFVQYQHARNKHQSRHRNGIVNNPHNPLSNLSRHQLDVMCRTDQYINTTHNTSWSSWLDDGHMSGYLSDDWCLPGGSSPVATLAGVGLASGIHDPFMCFPFRTASPHPSRVPVTSRKDKIIVGMLMPWSNMQWVQSQRWQCKDMQAAACPFRIYNSTSSGTCDSYDPTPFPSPLSMSVLSPPLGGGTSQAAFFIGTRIAVHWYAHAYYRFLSIAAQPYNSWVWGIEQPQMDSLTLRIPFSFLQFHAKRACTPINDIWFAFWTWFMRPSHRAGVSPLTSSSSSSSSGEKLPDCTVAWRPEFNMSAAMLIQELEAQVPCQP